MGLPLSAIIGREFLPTRVSDCRLWLRADLGVTQVANAVSAWADQSEAGDSNRNAVQATGAAKPTYVAADANFNGKPTVSFDGGDNLRTGAFTGGPYAQPITIYVAFRSSASAVYVFDDLDNTSRIVFGTGVSTSGFIFAGTQVNVAQSINTTHVAGLVYNGASSAGYIDDSQTAVASGDAGSNALKALTIGARFTLDTNLIGQIAEIIVYSGAHNAETRQWAMKYMGNRYAVAVT